ncbi:MAG: hypothetical protein ABSB13_16580, partial [Candidatus Binatus sp.]|uniref:hypothetical protein n=1 Tax=Candidatus Binatus sp. TaxID=2811406 RepID=UPI003D150A1A
MAPSREADHSWSPVATQGGVQAAASSASRAIDQVKAEEGTEDGIGALRDGARRYSNRRSASCVRDYFFSTPS